MKSGLTPLFSDADIDRWFDKFQERAEERIFKLLSAAGEKFGRRFCVLFTGYATTGYR